MQFGSKWSLFILTLMVWACSARLIDRSHNVTRAKSGFKGTSASKLDVKGYILREMNNTKIRENLRFLTKNPHLAGTKHNNALADQIARLWKSYGFDSVEKVLYNVLLSYPDINKPNKVELLDANKKVIFKSKHKEDILRPEDRHDDFIPMYNSFSPNGTVEGELVYAHFATTSDFETLVQLGIDLKGKIVIAQYGKIYRGNKVELAATYGAIGIILYNDPHLVAQEGEEPENVYPYKWWLQGSGAQRGSIKTLRGDSQTPDYPSLEDVYRMSTKDVKLPQIPCQPISYNDAKQLLKLLKGQKVPTSWSKSSCIAGNIGPGFVKEQSGKTVRLTVNNYMRPTNITDVIGIIKGRLEPDRYILAGNHRDAWGFGGVDASSGTSQLLEVSRIYGNLLKKGWRPRRSIVFCSWDAEEFGLIGSYEWVEDNIIKLSRGAVAYINSDSCVGGDLFQPCASPFLAHLVIKATKMISDPKNNSRTLYDAWVQNSKRYGQFQNGEISVHQLRGGTDHVPMAFVAGVASIDIAFKIDQLAYKTPFSSYPAYHTGFDTFYLVDQFIDPNYNQQKTCGLINGFLLHDLAESELLPFNVTHYANAVLEAFNSLKAAGIYDLLINKSINIDRLEARIEEFVDAARGWQQRLPHLNTTNPFIIRGLNDQLTQLEQAFLHKQGIPLQPQYRHLIFALSLHNMYGGSSFPGIRDLLHEISTHPVGSGEVDPRWQQLERHISDLIVAFHQATRSLLPLHVI